MELRDEEPRDVLKPGLSAPRCSQVRAKIFEINEARTRIFGDADDKGARLAPGEDVGMVLKGADEDCHRWGRRGCRG